MKNLLLHLQENVNTVSLVTSQTEELFSFLAAVLLAVSIVYTLAPDQVLDSMLSHNSISK